MREPLPLKVAVPLGTAAGAAIGVIAGSLYLGWAMRLPHDAFDMFLLVKLGSVERTVYAEEMVHAYAAVAALAALGAALAGASAFQRRLTTYGDAHWQSRAEMRRHGLIGDPGRGFVCAKLGEPGSKAPYVVACERPHVMVVAPTRAGKGVGFVIPNLLSFEGSAIVLDVKGELYRDTARWRGRQGRAVYRFAPFDWDKPGARYNPLERIAKLKTPEERYTAVEKLANLFLDKHNRENSTFSEAGQSIFVAACLLALQRREPRLSAVRAIILEGQNKKKQYHKYAGEAADVKDETARLLWMEASSTSEKLLTSNIQALMTGGFKAWNNPAVRRATDACDFDFATFRAKPQSLYLCVAEDDIKALAPLLRLLFGDLIATLRHQEPGANEPHPVMILLDEFQQMGAMDYLERAIHTLASYGGRVALIAQSLASLDRIYGPEGRESFESGAALKLYIQPRDSRTVAEVSRAVGSCTREAVTKSYGVWRGIGGLKSQSVREEERPLLSETAARTMDPDDVLVLASPLMPIRARRIKHYDDPTFAAMIEAQKGMEWPVAPAAKEAEEKEKEPQAEAAPRPEAASPAPGGDTASPPTVEPPTAPRPASGAAPVPEAAPGEAAIFAPLHGALAAPALSELPPDAPLPSEAVARLEQVEARVREMAADIVALRRAKGLESMAPTEGGDQPVGPVVGMEPRGETASSRARKRLWVPGTTPGDGRQPSLDL